MDFIPEKSEIQISSIDFRKALIKDYIRELDIKNYVKQFRADK